MVARATKATEVATWFLTNATLDLGARNTSMHCTVRQRVKIHKWMFHDLVRMTHHTNQFWLGWGEWSCVCGGGRWSAASTFRIGCCITTFLDVAAAPIHHLYPCKCKHLESPPYILPFLAL